MCTYIRIQALGIDPVSTQSAKWKVRCLLLCFSTSELPNGLAAESQAARQRAASFRIWCFNSPHWRFNGKLQLPQTSIELPDAATNTIHGAQIGWQVWRFASVREMCLLGTDLILCDLGWCLPTNWSWASCPKYSNLVHNARARLLS